MDFDLPVQRGYDRKDRVRNRQRPPGSLRMFRVPFPRVVGVVVVRANTREEEPELATEFRSHHVRVLQTAAV